MELKFTFHAHDSHVIDLAFTHDTNYLITAGMDNLIHLWSVKGWKKVRTLVGHEKSVNSLSLTSSGPRLISASSDQTVRIWDIQDGCQVKQFTERGNAARLSPGDCYLGILDRASLVIKEFKTDTLLDKFKPFPKRTTTFVFSPDQEWLAIGGQGQEILIYHLPELILHHVIPQAHEGYVLSLAFSPKGNLLTSTGLEGQFRFWNITDWQPIKTVHLENPGVQSIAFSPLGNQIGVASDHKVTLIDPISMQTTQTIDLKPKGVYCLAFSYDGQWLACGAADKRVRIWSL